MANLRETEKCLVCGKETGVPKDTNVDDRQYYVVGAGQLCKECYKSLYPNESSAGVHNF